MDGWMFPTKGRGDANDTYGECGRANVPKKVARAADTDNTECSLRVLYYLSAQRTLASWVETDCTGFVVGTWSLYIHTPYQVHNYVCMSTGGGSAQLAR